MSDLALIWAHEAVEADLALVGAIMAMDDGLKTAVIVSLFTDRRAAADDVLPAEGGDRRGWWGDVAPRVAGDRIGSRLWLLAREKRLASVVGRAREYAAEALAWLVEDGVASSVGVDVTLHGDSALALVVTIVRPTGPSRYDFVWEAL